MNQGKARGGLYLMVALICLNSCQSLNILVSQSGDQTWYDKIISEWTEK